MTRAARITANSGVVKPSVVASASGSSTAAPKLQSIPSIPIVLRSPWVASRPVRSLPSWPVSASQPRISGSERAWRQNMISGSAMPLSPATFTSM